MVQHHRDLHGSLVGSPKGLASRGPIDSHVVNTKDVSDQACRPRTVWAFIRDS